MRWQAVVALARGRLGYLSQRTLLACCVLLS
jgi:hypothetical protein